MKILHVITTLVFGGAEKLLTSYANLQVGEHEVHIVYFKCEPNLLPSLDKRIQVHKIDLSLSAPFKLRKLIKSIQPTIVHSHLGHADLIGMTACFGLKVNYFITLHNVYFKKDVRDEVFYFFYRLLLTFSVPKAKVISVGKAVEENLARKKLHLSPERSILKLNAIADIRITESKQQLRERLHIAQDDFVLLFVGRLAFQKSVHTLLEAVAHVKSKIPRLKCIIIGEGDQLPSLLQRTKELEITEWVEFRGVTLEPELYFSSSDVFILPSLFEGLVTVVIEAFRSSLPVIASQVDGNIELITPDKTGMLFHVGNAQDLSDKIELLYRNQALRETLGKNGHEKYRHNFSIQEYNTWLIQLYSQN